MVMIKCNKRQKEIDNGELRHRCIHKEHPEYLEIVHPAVCEACPLAKMLKLAPCKDKAKPPTENATPVLHTAIGYPPCPYRYPDEDENLKCSITGLEVTSEICNRCDFDTKREAKNMPSLGQRAKNYFGAIRRWVAKGRPTRTQEEIDDLFEKHCGNDCERYDKEKHACKSCGCNISSDASPLGNKLAMATEHCPLGRF